MHNKYNKPQQDAQLLSARKELTQSNAIKDTFEIITLIKKSHFFQNCPIAIPACNLSDQYSTVIHMCVHTYRMINI